MTFKSILCVGLVTALLSSLTACVSLTPEEKKLAYERYRQRAERADMRRWELGRSGVCERTHRDEWRCDAGTP